MTGNSNKVRAVVLAALMIFSVFAGTVAFSGTAAASSPTYDGNAVHYVDQSGPTGVVEVPFDGGPIDITTVNNNTVTLLDDGENITSDVVTNVTTRTNSDGSTVIIQMNDTVASDDLEVEITDGLESVNSQSVTNPGEKSVVFAGNTREFTGGNSAFASSPGNASVYQGATAAINVSDLTNGTDAEVTVEGEDNNYFQEGSTGVNSTVFTFDTSNRELGEYKVFIQDTDDDANRSYINVRDLQLDIEVDDLNVSTEDTIETDVSAVAGNRDIEAKLLDSNGDTINTSGTNRLDGQGTADVDFDAATADGGNTLDTGTYTVEVTDNNTGIVVESSEITVSEADDAEAEFAQNTLSQERGDIIEFTVEMTETDYATVSFGEADSGVIANATLEDDDGDGEVTAYLNTYNLYDGTDNDDAYYLDSDSDDNIVQLEEETQTDDLIDAGNYDIEVQATGENPTITGDPVDDSDDVATVALEERSNEEFRTWTAPDGTNVNDLEDVNEALADGEITQSSEISNGDIVVHQLVGSGFEGALDAEQNEDVTTDFFASKGTIYNLTVEEASPGANQDPKNLTLNSTNTDVIADGPNDTYFVIFDTDNSDLRYGDNSQIEDDTELEANFSVLSNDETNRDFVNEDNFDSDENEETTITYDVVEPDITVNEPFNVSQAEGQTITGTTTLAPTTELSIRVRSQSGVSPSFLKTASPEVQADGTFSATFDFSNQNVGDEYDIDVDGDAVDTSEEGEVVEAVSTDTATPEPDTDTATPEPDTDTATPEPDTDTATPEPDTDTAMPDTDTATSTPTSTPGFGVIVALTALLAAALLAVRRDS